MAFISYVFTLPYATARQSGSSHIFCFWIRLICWYTGNGKFYCAFNKQCMFQFASTKNFYTINNNCPQGVDMKSKYKFKTHELLM